MEPKLPAPNRGSEQLPNVFTQGGEYTPSVSTPEHLAEQRHEAVEARPETSPTSQQQPAVLPAPVQIPVAPTDDAAVVSDSKSVPLTAADDDLIEKEWVDKAKAIVTETKDDPYRREQEVGKLQADYLRKRYGKELGAS